MVVCDNLESMIAKFHELKTDLAHEFWCIHGILSNWMVTVSEEHANDVDMLKEELRQLKEQLNGIKEKCEKDAETQESEEKTLEEDGEEGLGKKVEECKGREENVNVLLDEFKLMKQEVKRMLQRMEELRKEERAERERERKERKEVEDKEEKEPEDPPPLVEAASLGCVTVVQSLLAQGVVVRERDADGFNALHRAASNGHREVVSLLLRAEKQLISTRTSQQPCRTALHLAAAEGHFDVVKTLLQAGADIATRDGDWQTSLHHAAEGGHAALVDALLDKGVASDAVDKSGRSALHIAAKSGHANVVRVLLERSASVVLVDTQGHSALYAAAAEGHLPVVEVLLQRGGWVIQHSYYSPLHAAAANGHAKVIKFILHNGIGLINHGFPSTRPLVLAAEGGHVEAVKELARGGAELTTTMHAIEAAARKGCYSVVTALIQALPAIVTEYGTRALGYAVECNLPEALSALIHEGVDPNVTWNLRPILETALSKHHHKCVQVLRDAGVMGLHEMFGQIPYASSAPRPTNSLFGTQTIPGERHSVFGAAQNAVQQSQQIPPAGPTGGVFGTSVFGGNSPISPTKAPYVPSIFVESGSQRTQAGATSLFGASPASGRSLFGENTGSQTFGFGGQPAAAGGLFGVNTGFSFGTSSGQQTTAGAQAFGCSVTKALFGTKSASMNKPEATLFGVQNGTTPTKPSNIFGTPQGSEQQYAVFIKPSNEEKHLGTNVYGIRDAENEQLGTQTEPPETATVNSIVLPGRDMKSASAMHVEQQASPIMSPNVSGEPVTITTTTTTTTPFESLYLTPLPPTAATTDSAGKVVDSGFSFDMPSTEKS